MPTDTALKLLFSQILSLEIVEIQVLLELLNEEHQLLQQTSPEPLKQLTEKKRRQIEKLEAAVIRQNEFLGQQELPPDRQGVETFLQQFTSDNSIRDQCRQFEELLDACQKQNSINGSMLAQSRLQVTHALELLHGVSEGQKTYGPSGEARSTQSTNSLGKA